MKYSIEIHSTNGRVYDYTVSQEQLEDLTEAMDDKTPLIVREEGPNGVIVAVIPFHSVAMFMSIPIPENQP